MPSTVRVLARKSFEYNGRAFVAGPINLSPVDAAILSRRGLVNISTSPDPIRTRHLVVAPPATKAKRVRTRASRKQYNRRDMTAEGTEQ